MQNRARPRLRFSSFLYPHIFEPIREDGVDILYVFVCGAFIEPERYLSFLTTLRATATDLRLWIAVVMDSKNLTPETLESSLDEALIKAQELGFRSSSGLVFMGGHSLGGKASKRVAYKCAVGLIQLGCSFFIDNNLVEYPVPVLTVIGSRDGQTGYRAAALDAFHIAKVEAEFTEEHTYYHKPVIVIPGMNHAQGYDGENPSFERGDLVAEISVEQAHTETASAIAAFLMVTSQGIASKTADNERARNILKAKVDVNREACLAFGKAMDEQGDGAENMQIQVAAGSPLTADKVTVVHHQYMNNFTFSRPYEIGGRIIIPVYLHELAGSHGILFNMWVKFRRSEPILKTFDCAGFSDFTDAISTARELNEITLKKALELVSNEGRQKYFREGLQLRFVGDLVLDSGNSWDDSDVVIRPSKDDEHLHDCQSPVYNSDGVFHMKLITLGRAMTWIYEEAFRLYEKI